MYQNIIRPLKVDVFVHVKFPIQILNSSCVCFHYTLDSYQDIYRHKVGLMVILVHYQFAGGMKDDNRKVDEWDIDQIRSDMIFDDIK